MNQPLTKEEEDQLYNILSLLEITYSSKDNEKIKEAQNQLQIFASNLPVFPNLLFKSLLIVSLKEKPITLELHKSAIIYLRNIILKTSGKLKAEEIYEYIKKFCSLLFSWGKNINLTNSTISLIIQNIISFYLSLDGLKDNDKYIESIFSDVTKIISEPNTEFTNESNILITCEKIISLSKSLITSKNIKMENYEKFLKNYYFLNADKILDLGKNYLIPNKSIYNNKYFSILKALFESFYAVLNNFSSLCESIKNLCLLFFKKYWKEFALLIELCPPLDKPSAQKFQKQNPIVFLNIKDDNCKHINLMKSSVIQLICILTQNIFEISNDMDYNKKKNEQNTEINDLINFLVNLIKLSVKCFEDLLSNKEIFLFVRNYDLENSDEENSINILLYDLCVLQCRLFIREPFKNIFRNDIKLFLLNILLPLFSTNDTERNAIENDYDSYHDYLIDNIEFFKMKNFRASGMFLINKICNFFGDENNFLLSYTLEMFNYTINEGNINNKVNYNIYLENKDKFKIDKLDIETKLDLFFLIILLLRNKIRDNILIKNRLRELLIENQSKMHQINSLAIKIKICKMYSVFIPLLFKDDDNNISKKKKIDIENAINKPTMSKENEIKNNTFSEEHYKFIKNAIIYLLKNIEQNVSPNSNISEKKDYLQSLSHSAAECISDLIISFKENIYEENEEGSPFIKNEKYSVIEYIYQSLSENFRKIINLIIFIDNPSFYNLIDYVLENIKPKEREDIFICLNNITQKFIKDFKINKDKENTITPFLIEYYKIISDFLKGVNKLNINDKNEINLFEGVLDQIFQCVNVNELKNLEESDELIEMIEEYIILVKYLNEKSLKIFKQILPIINKDKTLNSSLFSFLCTFMKYLPKTQNLGSNAKPEIVNEMILIIKESSNFNDEMYNNSVKHALLLTLNLFNVCINEISFDIFKELILLSLNSFAVISKEDLFVGDVSEKIVTNQIVLSNISFGFIFRPSDVYKIIFEKKKDNEKKEKNKENNQNNQNPQKISFDNYSPNLPLFINLILTDLGAATNDYIILLNKCIILGFCSIFKEKYCLEQLNTDMNLKILMINIFAKLIEKHKKQQVGQLNKIMKKETNCNFIEESEFEEEEDEEDEDLEDIKFTIQGILCENQNIKSADEYKYFCEIVTELKKTDKNTYDVLNESFNGQLENLLLVRNININYKGKEFKVPRKTVKILKKKK